MTGINNTLRKLKVLAEGTEFEHERDSALKMLNELMEKHGITEADLEDETVTTQEFKWKGAREKAILIQVFYKVMDDFGFTTYSFSRNGRTIRNTIGLDCTVAQKLEIDFLFSFYKELYQKEEETFFSAFVQKHKIFGTPAEPRESKLSEYERLKILQLMNGIDDATPHRQIEEKVGRS